MPAKHRFIVALVVWLAASACGKDSPTAVTTNPFVGTWRLLTFDGNPASGITWTFTEAGVTINAGSQAFSGTYSYDAGTNPHQLDLRVAGTTPNPNLAIYNFSSASSLVIKLMDGASTRSTNFSIQTGYEVQEFSKQ